MSKKTHGPSYFAEVINKDGIRVNVPVINVTDGPAERALGMQIIKHQNNSKFINYNEYHMSRKKYQN